MKINFNLATPGNKVSSIRVVVTHKGKVYRKAVGLSCPVRDWSSSKQRTGHTDIDRRLKDILIYIEGHADELTPGPELKEIVELSVMDEDERKERESKNKGIPTFWDVFRERCDRSKTTKSIYSNVVRIAGEKGDWNDITVEWFDRIVRRMKAEGYSSNSIDLLRKHITAAMNWGLAMGYHNNRSPRMFQKLHEESFSVYLTQAEVDRLWEAKFEYDYFNKVRDLFLLGVYTASRVSDYSRMTMDNVRDGLIEFYQQKTEDRVTIPCSPRVLAILERNGGHAPHIHYNCFIERIKDVCKAIGMTQVVQVPESTRRRLNKAPNEPVRRYELVSSHTARRTGATLLYMTGVPITQCRMITGHKSESSFLKYIRVTKEENARMLADNPFFK